MLPSHVLVLLRLVSVLRAIGPLFPLDSLALSVKLCKLVAAMERRDDSSEECSVG